MTKRRLLAGLFFITGLLLAGCGNKDTVNNKVQPTEASVVQTPAATVMENKKADSTILKERYEPYFKVGAAINGNTKETAAINDKGMSDILKKHFNSTTLSNLMKPCYILDEKATKTAKDGMPVVTFKDSEASLKFCQKNGISMRGHVLVWHNQTPKWFFCKDYDENNDYVSKEVMSKRMEAYIQKTMEYVQTNYPGVVYCWDVVNECVADTGSECDDSKGWDCRTAFNGDDNYWYATMGTDYVYKAFEYARKYAADGVSLIYNDYNVFEPSKRDSIYELAKQLKQKGLIDGLGLQPTVTLDYPAELSGTDSDNSFENCLLTYSKLGLEIQITELSFLIDEEKVDRNKETLQTQADRYGEMMKLLLKMDSQNGGPCNITSVSVFGICDDYPLYDDCVQSLYLFDKNRKPKKCFDTYMNALTEFLKGK